MTDPMHSRARLKHGIPAHLVQKGQRMEQEGPQRDAGCPDVCTASIMTLVANGAHLGREELICSFSSLNDTVIRHPHGIRAMQKLAPATGFHPVSVPVPSRLPTVFTGVRDADLGFNSTTQGELTPQFRPRCPLLCAKGGGVSFFGS